MIRRFILRLLGLDTVRDELASLHQLQCHVAGLTNQTRTEMASRIEHLELRVADHHRTTGELVAFQAALRGAVSLPKPDLAGVREVHVRGISDPRLQAGGLLGLRPDGFGR